MPDKWSNCTDWNDLPRAQQLCVHLLVSRSDAGNRETVTARLTLAFRGPKVLVPHGAGPEKEVSMLGRIFKAYDIRGTYPDLLNDQMAWQIGFGCARFLLEDAAAAGETTPMMRTLGSSKNG